MLARTWITICYACEDSCTHPRGKHDQDRGQGNRSEQGKVKKHHLDNLAANGSAAGNHLHMPRSKKGCIYAPALSCFCNPLYFCFPKISVSSFPCTRVKKQRTTMHSFIILIIVYRGLYKHYKPPSIISPPRPAREQRDIIKQDLTFGMLLFPCFEMQMRKRSLIFFKNEKRTPCQDALGHCYVYCSALRSQYAARYLRILSPFAARHARSFSRISSRCAA